MTHQELLNRFFTRSLEQQLHRQILASRDFVMPVEEVRDFMQALTHISLTEFFNYLDNHPSFLKEGEGEVVPCGSLQACTDELCSVLLGQREGLAVREIGQSEVFSKYLRVHHPASWSRCGAMQAKAAGQFGLAFREAHRWYLSCFGYVYAFPQLSRLQQQRFLVRALLRNVFYARVLSQARMGEVQVSQFLTGLSASTQGSRSASIKKLLTLCLDEMDQEGIRRYDILVPKYRQKTKTVYHEVLKGTRQALDTYALHDEYFSGGIPLYSVKAACGYFVDHEIPEQEGWMDLSASGVRTNSEDYFVVRAKGDSMLPKIKDGDLCLFRWYRGESLYDDIVLTQCREYDSEYESSYTIKRFHYDNRADGAPQTVSLQPLNREKYEPIVLSGEDGQDYKTIGLFVKVLEA